MTWARDSSRPKTAPIGRNMPARASSMAASSRGLRAIRAISRWNSPSARTQSETAPSAPVAASASSHSNVRCERGDVGLGAALRGQARRHRLDREAELDDLLELAQPAA